MALHPVNHPLARRGFILSLCAAASCCSADSSGPVWQSPVPVTRSEDARPLRVLFIGNSLTYYNDLPARTREIAAHDAALRVMETVAVVKGGASLQSHWNGATARARITAERWDYVVLQEGTSLYYDDPDSLVEVVRGFDQLIRQAGARTVFYMTWPLAGTIPQDSLTRVASRLQQQLHVLVAPVGKAWGDALAGDPSLELYLPDGNHPAPTGTYLGACTMFATLFRRTPAGLAGLQAIGDTSVVTLTPQTALLLQQTAWTAAQPFLGP